MSRILSISRSVLVVAAMITVSACESAPTAPTAIPRSPRLAVSTNESDRPFAFNVTGCTEVVRVTGTFHVLFASTVSASGETMDRIHINANGTGIGRTTGAEYGFNDEINLTQHTASGSLRTDSQIETLKLIGRGAVPDQIVRARFRVTVNANGETTVEIDEFETVCN